MGPKPFIAFPDSFNREILDKTAKLMDILSDKDDLFIRENPEEGLKSINLSIMVPSKWARGRREITQLSVFTSEESPSLDVYRSQMRDAKDTILADEDIYMAFYKHKALESIELDDGQDPAEIPAMIEGKYKKLRDIVQGLNDQIKLRAPTNYPYIKSMAGLLEDPLLPIPASALNELKDLVSSNEGTTNIFTVFRKVGDMIRVDLIPARKQVLRVKIIVRELSPEIIMETGKAIRLPLLFTSGICQDKGGKCSYEAFFSLPEDPAGVLDRIHHDLELLDFVESIKLERLFA